MPKSKGKSEPPVRQEPGPGRSTSEAAFNDLKSEIAKRNELAHIEARKLRTERDRERQRRRREQDAGPPTGPHPGSAD